MLDEEVRSPGHNSTVVATRGNDRKNSEGRYGRWDVKIKDVYNKRQVGRVEISMNVTSDVRTERRCGWNVRTYFTP